jgi:hypothetical protein
MKKNILNFLFTIVLLNSVSCFSQDIKSSKQKLNDSTKKVLEINIASNSILKGLNSLDLINVYGDTAFLITDDSRLVEVNLKNGSVTSFHLSSFIDQQKKAGYPLSFFAVYEDCYCLCFRNVLYKVLRTGKVQKIFTNGIVISWIEKIKNGFLVADQEVVKIIDEKGKMISSTPFVSFGSNNGFITSNGAIAYQALPTDNIVEFKSATGLKIEVKEFAPILVKGVKEPFISYADSGNLIGFDYWKRNKVYVFKKGIKDNAVIKTISLLGFNYTPTVEEINKEEGYPNFKIAYNKQLFYIIALWHGKLKITTFTM